MQDAIRKPPESIRADPVEGHLFRRLPGRKSVDHLGVTIGPQKVAEFNVDDFRDLTHGDLPSVRYADAR